MNNVTLIGRLTKDPELKYLPGDKNTAVVRFGLAVDKQLSKDKKAEMESRNQPTADFINIKVWGRLAELCANWTSKGAKVGIQGSIQTGSYEAKDGTRRYTFEVIANNVEFLDSRANSEKQELTDETDLQGMFTIDDEDIPF